MRFEWDLSRLFNSFEDWEKEKEMLQLKLNDYEDSLFSISLTSIDKLVYKKFKILKIIEYLYVYPKRRLDLDNNDELSSEKFDEISKIYTKYEELNVVLEKFIVDHLEEIEINDTVFQRYFDDLKRKKEHQIQGDSVKVLTELQPIFSSIDLLYQDVTNKDFYFGTIIVDGQEKDLSISLYNKLLLSLDSEQRKNAFLCYSSAYKRINYTLSEIFNLKLDKEMFICKLENFSSLKEKRLFLDGLPSDLLDRLIRKSSNNLFLLERINLINKKTCGFEESSFHIYDLKLDQNLYDKKYSIEEATHLIKKALSPVKEGYPDLVDKAFLEGWIDAFSKKNRRKNSFCALSYTGLPYILINYDESFQSVKTLCHELGHAFHTFYAKNSQPFETFEFSTFLTEIVAKVHELLLFESMLGEVSDISYKKYLLKNIVSQLNNSIFGQVMLTEFEDKCLNFKEEKGRMPSQFLNDSYFELYKHYHSGLTMDDSICYLWETIPHFFIYDSYYCYQYAVGFCIAVAIVQNLFDDSNYYKKYLLFLKSGGSLSLQKTLSILDINIDNDLFFDTAFHYLEEKITLLETM